MASSDLDERSVTISGVKVVFPCKPYPSQFSMMDKVIKGLERKQNSLLESPTGSGKSLALLCSALAWQNVQHEKLTKENLAAQSGDCCKPCQCEKKEGKVEYSPESKPNKSSDPVEISDDDDAFKDDDDDDFKPSRKSMSKSAKKEKGRSHVSISYEEESKDCPPSECTCGAAGTSHKKQKVPKIYFGTRTHKQISQITRELRKTAYHDVRMVILASREHTCIHPEVSRSKNKSEGCRERLDIHGPGCKFNDRAKRTFLSQGQLQAELGTAWDLEDLNRSCSIKKACPYFVTRNVMEQADIVFCPYNYLIDPIVRKSMDINLKDQIVILDEAHNIEDCARDAASGNVTTDQMTQAIHNIQELLDHNVKFADHLKLRNMLENLQQLVESNSTNFEQTDYDSAYTVWSGFDIVARLKNIGLGPDKFQEYQRSFESVMMTDEDEQIRNRRNELVKINSGTAKLIEQLFQILDYMYRHDLKFVEDYRLCVMRSMQYVANRDTNDRWLGKNRRGGSRIMVFTLNFWCMNPAVAFSDFSCCRNVVLSSGTLSPMSSFSSELGSPFPIQLEASHVIEDKQVYVGAIGVGPSGSQLQAVYRNMETFAFQDELGNLVHQVCMSVPHGVLCFLPSYRALQKFTERWKLTGLWNKIARRKRIMVEPRAADREEFDDMMKAFYDVVRGDTCSDYLSEDEHCEDDSDIDGALFFAVCRGKVSEGMDFADNNARAVITIGIPFPSIKDLQVKLKREYNDRYKKDRGLLSGNDWYEIQAFRALNQALGRCIRHRKDWGALIMVDDRFVKNPGKYHKSLSRWVRSKVQTFNDFCDFQDSLQMFTEKMGKEMPVISHDTSFIPRTPGSSRRDSIYKRQSMDNSYMNTSGQESLYFGSPSNFQTLKLTQTPSSGSAKKDNSFTSPKGMNSVSTSITTKGVNSSAPGLKLPTVTSPSIQQQLMDIVNSSTSPKDQPYYVILDKGLPTEKTFLIEPNKLGLGVNQPVGVQQPNQPVSLLPPTVPLMLTQGTNQQLIIQPPNPLLGQQQQVLFNIPPHMMQGTNQQVLISGNGQQIPVASSLLQGTISSTNNNADSSCLDKGDNLNTAEGNKGGNKMPTPGKGDNPKMVFHLGESALAPEEQLKQFLNTKTAPKEHAYYVVANKGLKNEATFLIEPNKKGKSKKDGKKDTDTKQEETADQKPVTVDTTSGVDKHTAIDEKSSMQQETMEPDSSTADDIPTQTNKFLKFCHLPVTPAKSDVPVATVTPQRAVDGKQQSTTTAQRQNCTSPVLFDDNNSNIDNKDNVKTTVDITDDNTKTGRSVSKKPIFKKRSSLSRKGAQGKDDLEIDDGNEMEGEKVMDTDGDELKEKEGKHPEGVENKMDKKHDNLNNKMDDTMKVDDNVKKGSRSGVKRNIRGTGNKSVAEKLRQFRREPVDKKDDEIDMNTKNHESNTRKVKDEMEDTNKGEKNDKNDNTKETKPVLKELKGASNFGENVENEAEGMDGESDEEFLNTRRRGGRKRKSTTRYLDWAKRAKKGVEYDEEEENAVKENMGKQLSCAKCGLKWMKLSEHEKRKRHPGFVSGVFKKNTELLFFTSTKIDSSALVPVTGESGVKGLLLNSIYDVTHGCCVQYLQCNQCSDSPVIGARVLLADSTSQFKSGQTWISMTAAKM